MVLLNCGRETLLICADRPRGGKLASGPNAGRMENQNPEWFVALLPEIERVKSHLAAGGRPSEIANVLRAKGLFDLQLILVFREATGASLADLKAFGQWWGPHGVTDEPAFDAWAAKVFPRARPS